MQTYIIPIFWCVFISLTMLSGRDTQFLLMHSNYMRCGVCYIRTKRLMWDTVYVIHIHISCTHIFNFCIFVARH
jgi:hypothetical protein